MYCTFFLGVLGGFWRLFPVCVSIINHSGKFAQHCICYYVTVIGYKPGDSLYFYLFDHRLTNPKSEKCVIDPYRHSYHSA